MCGQRASGRAATYRRLDIAVGESGFVHHGQPSQDLRYDLLDLGLGQYVVVVGQVFLQIPVLAVFHGDVQIAGAVVPAKELDEEIRVLELAR